MANASDLFLSILALDSYNRGYLPGISGLSDADGTHIGNATITRTTSDTASQSGSFYAVAYAWGGQTVISFRGTRFDSDLGPNGQSVLNGWTLSAGYSNNAQTELAANFYTSVTGRSLFPATPDTNVVFTGHSLGGGTAGYLASLTGARASIYNNIAFGSAVVAAIASENYARGGSDLVNVITGALSGPGYVALPANSAGINQFITSGEIAAAIRIASPLVSAAVFSASLSGQGIALPVAIAAGTTGAVLGRGLDASTRAQSLGAGTDFGLDASRLHSQALMVLQLFADVDGHTDWLPIAKHLGSAFFDEALALAAGNRPSDVDGWYSPSGKMLASIAYSAVEEDSPSEGKPFGDKAVRALFNDADQIGRYVDDYAGEASLILSGVEIETALTRIAVQFAADVALRASTSAEDAKGVIGWETDSSTFQIDLDHARYSATFGGGGTNEVLGVTPLLDAITGRLEAAETGAAATALSSAFAQWRSGGAKDASVLVTSILDGRSVDVSGTLLPEANGVPGGMIFLSGAGADRIVGSPGDDIIAGGAGDDRIRTAGGRDVLIGGAGDDILVADGFDLASHTGATMIGGEGADKFVIDYAAGGTPANKTRYTIYDAGATDRLYLGSFFGDALTTAGSSDEILFPLLGGTRDWNPFQFQSAMQGPDLFYANKPNAFDNYKADGSRGSDGIKEWVFDLGGFNDGWSVQARYQITGPDLLIFLAAHNRGEARPTNVGSFVFAPEITAIITVVDYDAADLGLTFYNQMTTYEHDFINNTDTPIAVINEIVAGQIATLSSATAQFVGSQSTISAAWADDPVQPRDATSFVPTLVVAAAGPIPGPTITGTSGSDVIELTAPADPQTVLSLTTVDATAGVDTLTVGGATQGVELDLSSGVTDIGYALAGFENVVGTMFADTLRGNAFANVIWGRVGNDVIDGLAGSDRLLGEDGDDTIAGGGGNDTIDGGVGIDIAWYSANRSDYSISRDAAGTLRIVDNRAGALDGRDGVVNVEFVAFADGTVSEFALANHAPTGSGPAGFIATSNAPLTLDAAALLSGIIDPDGDALALSAVGSAQHAVVVLANGTVVFTPQAGYLGAAGFDLTISDGAGGTLTVAVPVYIADVNGSPDVALAIPGQSSLEDVGWSFTVPTGTFIDPDGDALTLSARLADGTLLPTWLAFDAASATFSGTPPQNYSGNIDLIVSAWDGLAAADTAFRLTIVPVNDDPIAPSTISLALIEDTAGPAIAIGATDVDADPLTFGLKSGVGPAKGVVQFSPVDGTYRYTPNADANGADAFVIVVSDGHGGTFEQSVNVLIAAVNDPAVITGILAGTVVEDGALVASGTLSIVDPDTGEAAFVAASAIAAPHGQLAIGSNGAWSYQLANADPAVQALNAGQILIDQIVVTSIDGTSRTITITIQGANEGTSGTPGNDVITGTAGADRIVAGAGADVVSAGGGNDVIVATIGDGNDVYDGGTGIDTYDLSGTTAAATVTLGIVVGSVMLGGASSSQTGADALANFENVSGGNGNDTLIGNSLANVIAGNAGADRLVGLAGNDTLSGGAGNDTFSFTPGFGRDVITDFAAGAGAGDVIELAMGSAFNSFAEILAASSQAGANTVISFNSTTSITLEGVFRTSLASDDFRYF